jgi:mannosyl-oligosaccharide alpha-1,2-mannosidase
MKLSVSLHIVCTTLLSIGGCEIAVPVAQRASVVRDAVKHFWIGYKNSSWGSDEVRPIAGGSGGDWGDVGMMILDSLDTLWIAGLRDEFMEGECWVSKMNFNKLDHAERTSFFEMIIRGLGGLLAAYSLSGHSIFLEKAKDLGNRLLNGFPKQGFSLRRQNHRWPVSYIDIHNPVDVEITPSFHSEFTALADAGSNILEFNYLSQIVGDSCYKNVADASMNNIIDLSGKTHQYLAPKTLEPYSLNFESNRVSVGAMADSYFEYLLKRYIQSGKRDQHMLEAWKGAMSEMRQALVRTTPEGLTYIAMESSSETNGKGPPSYSEPTPEMEHLACFVGGMLALGSHFAPASEVESWWLPTGIELTRTCYEMYNTTPSGLAPEKVSFRKGQIIATSPEYRLRPETLESLFYLYRITGNETYREWSWNIFQAINKHTRTRYGFAKVSDVRSLPVPLEDSEETFMVLRR